jgi:hypothetical protein
MKESTTYQAILREGQKEGALSELKRVLLLQGERRFGPPDPRSKVALEKIDDVGRLEEMSVRLLSVRGCQDLLGQPAPRRRNGRRRPTP